jgi:polysaccharide biosynthesis protein PslH
MHRWLVILPYFPIPANHGGKLDSLNFLEAAIASDVQVACLSTFNPGEGPSLEDLARLSQLSVQSWTFERDTTLRAFLDFRLPFQVASRRLMADHLEPVRLAMREFRPTAVIAMQHYTFALASLFANEFNLPILMRSQNLESNYFLEQSRASSNPLKRLYLCLESWRMVQFERVIYGSARLLAIGEIAAQDVEWHASRTSSKVVWLPPFLKLQHVVREPVDAQIPILLYVGALSMPNNLRGLEWFFESVWPELARAMPNLTFQVVGSRPTPELQRRLETLEHVELHMNVPDLAPYYARANAFVNPIFHGSGINMKNIEAMGYGLPLVTTSFGARGLSWQHDQELLIADSAKSFLDQILALLADDAQQLRLSQAARVFVERELEPQRNIGKWLELLT